MSTGQTGTIEGWRREPGAVTRHGAGKMTRIPKCASGRSLAASQFRETGSGLREVVVSALHTRIRPPPLSRRRYRVLALTRSADGPTLLAHRCW
jgi:hypothetical protein